MTTVTTGPARAAFVETDPAPGDPGLPTSWVSTVVVPSPFTATRYSVVVAELVTHTPLGALSTAVPGTARDALNGAGNFSFTCSETDANIDALVDLSTAVPRLQGVEVQLWRDGVLAWWGIPDTCDASDGTVSVQCYGGLGLLYNVEFGEKEVPDLYPNYRFADGLTWWTKEGSDPLPSMTVLPDESSPDGDHSLTLVGSGSDDTYGACSIYATTSHDFSPGLWYAVTFRLFVNSGVVVQRSRLVTVVVRNPSTGAAIDGGTYYLDDSQLEAVLAKSGVWQTVTLKVFIPGNTSCRVQAYVSAPKSGIMRCSYVALRRNEAWATPEDGQDRTTWLRRIVYGAQDPAEGYAPLGLDTAGDECGQVVVRNYPHADRGNIGRAIEAEWVDTGTGDWGIPSDSHTVTFWPDGRGSRKPEHTVTETRTAYSVKVGWDGSDVRTSVVAQGDGDGITVESARWTDATNVPLVLSETVRAEQGTPYKDLGLIAYAKVTERSAVGMKVTTTVPGDLWGDVEPGDTIPHRIPLWGETAIFDGRVMARTLDPETDSVSWELLA